QVGHGGHTKLRPSHSPILTSRVDPQARHTRRLVELTTGQPLAEASRVSGSVRPQLGRLIVTPFATIGVLAAVLMWEIEHVGSIALLLAIAGGGLVVGVMVSRRLRGNVERLAEHYETLLTTAEEQSRQAESANRLQ